MFVRERAHFGTETTSNAHTHTKTRRRADALFGSVFVSKQPLSEQRTRKSPCGRSYFIIYLNVHMCGRTKPAKKTNPANAGRFVTRVSLGSVFFLRVLPTYGIPDGPREENSMCVCAFFSAATPPRRLTGENYELPRRVSIESVGGGASAESAACVRTPNTRMLARTPGITISSTFVYRRRAHRRRAYLNKCQARAPAHAR